MKALVIGGNGFIGSHLVDKLMSSGWDVSVLDLYQRRYGAMPDRVHFIQGDLTQQYLVREAVNNVDVVFHLAWATIHEVANRDPAADIHANLIPSVQLLEEVRLSGVRRFIFTSSGGTIYGPAQELPIHETHPQNPINAYGVSKLTVEKFIQMFHHLYGLDYAIFRPSVPYGPRQNPLGRQGAAAVFLYRVAKGLPITIWGDGSVTRDYFYISDLVDALVTAADKDLFNQRVFNIGGSEEISLNQLVMLVEETVGRKADIKYEPPRNFDAQRIVLDTNAARQILQWSPRISMRNGLIKTWDWIASTVDL